jgi:membrane associated rhomboid family serine protease
MGIYDRDYYREDRHRGMLNSVIPEGGVCKFLIIAQLAGFLLQVLDGNENSIAQNLGLQLDALLRGEIWRIATFSFVHPSLALVPLVFSLFFIWYFGSDLEQMYSAVEFLCFYIATVLIGGAAFLATSYFTGDPSALLMGSFGAITAVTVLYAWHFPNITIRLFFILPIPMWLMAVIEVVGAIFIARQQVPYILAGVAFGSLYYKKQWRISGLFQGWFARQSRERSRAKLRVFKPEDDDAEPVAVAAPKMNASVLDEHLEAKVDAVLEKMARSGKESLSENERQILLRASEIYRRKRT